MKPSLIHKTHSLIPHQNSSQKKKRLKKKKQKQIQEIKENASINK